MPVLPIDKDKARDYACLIGEAMVSDRTLDSLGESDAPTLMYAVALVLIGVHATSKNIDTDIGSDYIEAMANALISCLDVGSGVLKR